MAAGLAFPAVAYDASWYRAAGWSGEYPNGFTMTVDVTTNIRANPDPDAPKSQSCFLREGATYHEWNKKRVRSDKLEFVSFTKIATHALKTDYAAHVWRTPSNRAVVIHFKKGDQYQYLAYGAEGTFLIRHKGGIYMADQGLAEKSVEVPPLIDKENNYDEWLKLTCANGARGWILMAEIRNAPGFSEPNIVEYGVARDTTIAQAQDVERICRGEFTDMRVIGLTLGDCDLNSISDSEVSYVKRVCGEPWGPDPSENNNEVPKCAIKVIASRTKSIPPENHGYGAPLYQVRKVLVSR
jgi:hypothetical protein